MASKKEKQRLLSGTLNLLPPSDKIPDGDALILDNWRVDQQGALRSTKGSVVTDNGVIGASGTFHTLARSGSDRYLGLGTTLFHGTPATPSSIATGLDGNPLGVAFYQSAAWVMNRAKQLRVQGGVAQKWGIAAPVAAPAAAVGSAQAFVQIEDYQSDPGGGALQAGMDVSYFDSDGNIHTVGSANASYDAVNVVAGQPKTLKVNANTAALWVVTDNLIAEGTAPIDTTAGLGPPQDDDEFRIWIFCSAPSSVNKVGLALFSGPIATTQKRVYVVIPGSQLNQTPNSWTQFRVLRNIDLDQWAAKYNALGTVPNDVPNLPDLPANIQAAIDLENAVISRQQQPHFGEGFQGNLYTGATQDTDQPLMPFTYVNPWNATGSATYVPQLLGPEAVSGVDWTALTAIQIYLDLNAPCVFNLAHAEMEASQTALSGSGNFLYSFLNAAGEDSDLSPASSTISLYNQGAALTSVAVSADAQVTARRIWRIGFGSNQVLLVGTINDNATTTYNDLLSTASAQAIGVVAPTNRTLPPAASGVMGPYFGKLLAWSTSTHPARYFWTPAGQPWYFPGADDNAEGNWEDAGGDDDPILWITNHTLFALIYKKKSLWRLMGDPVNVSPMLVDPTIGLVGPRAVVNAGDVDYFVGPEGIYRRNADFKEKISGVLDPIFKGDAVLLSTGETLPPIDPTAISQICMEVVNDRLYVSYPEFGQSFPNVMLVCKLPTRDDPMFKWARRKMFPNGGVTALLYEGGGNSMVAGQTLRLLGNNDWFVFLMEQNGVATDNTLPIHVAWQSRFSDQGLPDIEKIYSDVEVTFQTAVLAETPSTLTVYVVYDNGTKTSIGTINSATKTTVALSLLGLVTAGENLKAKNCAIRIEGDASSTCIVYDVFLHWYPTERLALTFDSGYTDLGIPERVKQVDYIEAYFESAAQTGNRRLSSDLPGSVLTQRDNTNFTMPNGRGNYRARLPQIVEGRNFRHIIDSATAFQLRRLRFRQRVIGEYLDGSINEFWESPEFPLGESQVGEVKDLLLDYDVSGAGGSVVLYTDLPGTGGLTIQRTLSVPAQTGRVPYLFQFEDGSDGLPYGRLAKVRVFPPNGGVLRMHGPAVVRLRPFGEFLDGSQGQFYRSPAFGATPAPTQVSELKDILLDYDVTGAGGQLILQSELPGSALTTRRTISIPAQTGRAPYLFQMEDGSDNLPYGRLFDVKVVPPSNGVLKLHAPAIIRLRPIGEYLDGAQGQFFESPAFSVAPGRSGELKDLLLDYEVSGSGGQILIYSDLPGTSGLQVQRTLAIPAHTSRQPFIFPLEDGSDQLPYGQLFKVKIIPPNNGVLKLHGRAVFRARIFGVYFDGTQGEVWETQPLDLFGGIGIFRDIEIVAQTGAAMTLEVLTELPNHDMQVAASVAVNSASTSVNRVPIYSRLPNGTKGQLVKFRLRGNAAARIFEVRVYGRGLGTTETNWRWVDVPLEHTPDEWAQIQIPIRETPEKWLEMEMPVRATPAAWGKVQLPARVTPEEFTWVDLPVDVVE